MGESGKRCSIDANVLHSGHASFWGDAWRRTQVDEKCAYETSEMRTNEKK